MKKITLQIFIWVFLAIPIVASASDRRECTYVNLMAGNTWGTTTPGSLGGNDVCILTHPGDSQDVLFGHYGGWQTFQTRTNTSDGKLYIQHTGQGPSGSHLTLKVLGYFTT